MRSQRARSIAPLTDRKGDRADANADGLGTSLAESVYSQIRAGIRTGTLRAGQRLLEVELARSLDVSRTPVREAIRRLASDGLIEVAPTRGMRVIELDKQRVREIYFLRELLEGGTARSAAQHATASDLQEMREVLDLSKTSFNQPAQTAKLNKHFHKLIQDCARNRYLAQALEQLSDSLALLPGSTFEVLGRPKEALAEHNARLAAIARRDADEAERLARAHIRMAGQTRLRMMFQGI